MQREHPSAEMVMLYRVFLTNERSLLADERKIAKGIYHVFFCGLLMEASKVVYCPIMFVAFFLTNDVQIFSTVPYKYYFIAYLLGFKLHKDSNKTDTTDNLHLILIVLL